METICDMRYICDSLHLSIWQLFNIAYAYKYKIFAVTNVDIVRFNNFQEVPDYVEEFIYAIIPKVRETTTTEKAEQEAHKTSPTCYRQPWNRRA